MGLAFASALVVLTASGVAISRLGSDERPARSSETASPAQAPDPATSGSAAAGQETAAPPAGTAGSSAVSSTPAPVPPPVPARQAMRRSPATPAPSPVGTPRSTAAAETGTAGSGAPAGVTGSGGSGASDTPTQGTGSGGSEGSRPPSSQGDPDSSVLLAASVSVGEGANGAVVGAGVGNNPETDVTVGDNHVVGDAPPSDGTAVDLGGRFLHPPPTLPTPPG